MSRRIIIVLGLLAAWLGGTDTARAQAVPPAHATNRVLIHADQGKETISRFLYGHFAEHLGTGIYGGVWVGEDSPIPNTRGIRNDVVAALGKIKAPVVRWPGGCFADEYHWRDGVGPRERRPKMVNTTWGGVVENNHFGTHEFFDLCGQIGAEPYVCGNVGSGTVREMMEWVEYMTFDGDGPMAALRRQNGRDKPWKLRFFSVGNESWGCGGGMFPEYYADLFRQYSRFVKNYGDNKLYRVACGPNRDDTHWTEVLMQRLPPRQANGLALHCYVTDRDRTATDFEEAGWFRMLKGALEQDAILQKHEAIMDRYDPQRRIDLVYDEWGTWYKVEPGTHPRFLHQQNTLCDAVFAGVTLNILNRHCRRVKMANIAQMVNVLQAMILTDGPKMLLTPTYHVFDMYQVHQDATLLPTDVTGPLYASGDETIPALSASASRDKAGKIHVTLCNLDPRQAASVGIEVAGAAVTGAGGRVLTAKAMNAHNTFDAPETVTPVPLKGIRRQGDALLVDLPARSVAVLELN
jgi:alpha-N-arabinofuranosidase